MAKKKVPKKAEKRARKKTLARPIVVPVDFSPNSESALLVAAEIARYMALPLLVLHVVHDPGEAPGYYLEVKGRKKQLKRLQDVAEEMLKAFMLRMAEKHPDLAQIRKAEHKLVVGLPASRILEVVDLVGARMVVMASAGRTGISRLLIGSKAEQVVRLCPVPVTIVKGPAEPAS